MSAPRNQVQNPPSSTVYARNLPYDINEDDIRQFFSPVGNPNRISLQNDRETGKFRGIAFVAFPSIEIAESAVRNLNKSPLKGREIFLDFSRERERRGGGNRHHDSQHNHHGHAPPPDMHTGPGMAHNTVSGAAPSNQHAPQAPQGTMYHTSGGVAYHQVAGASAPNGQTVGGPGQQIMFQGQPQMAPPGQMVSQTIIMTPDGQFISGAAPPGGMVVQGGQHMNMPGAPSGPEGAAVGGQQQQHMLLRPHGASGPPGPPQTRAVDASGGASHMHAMQIAGPQMHGGMMPVRAPHELQPDVPVGLPTAQHAAQQAANMLGNPQSASAPSQQATTSTISGMSPKQLFKILTELKAQMQADPEKGRKVLRENLPLTKALFQAQILLGMVNPEQPSMGAHNPPPQGAGAAADSVNGQGSTIKEEPPQQQHQMVAPSAAPTAGLMPAAAVDPREAALAHVAPAQREMLLKVMRLKPEEIARLPESQKMQLDKVRIWAAKNNIHI